MTKRTKKPPELPADVGPVMVACPGCERRLELASDAEVIPAHPRGAETTAAMYRDDDAGPFHVVAIVTIDRPCKWSGAIITKREVRTP